MSTPLFGSTYGSRLNTDENIFSYSDVFNYKNMTYHGFYGAGSLQAQELNELQEQCQIQNTVYSNILKNWLVYNNVNGSFEISTGIENGFVTENDQFIPENPSYIEIQPNTGLDLIYQYAKGWYFKRDENGFGQYIFLPTLQSKANSVIDYPYYITQKRVAYGKRNEWSFLRDTLSFNSLDSFGSHRLQDFLTISEDDSVVTPPPPPPAGSGTGVISDSFINNIILYTESITGEVKSISGWDPNPGSADGNFIGKGIRNVLTLNDGNGGWNLTPPLGITGVKQISEGYGYVVVLREINGIQSLTAWGNPTTTTESDIKKATGWFNHQLAHYKGFGKRLDGIKIRKIATGAQAVGVLFENGEVIVYRASTDNNNPVGSEPNTVWTGIGSIPVPVKGNAAYILGWTGYVSSLYGPTLSSYRSTADPSTQGCFPGELGPSQLDGITWRPDLLWRLYRGSTGPNCGRDPSKDSPASWATITGAPADYQFSRETVGISGPNYSEGAWHKQHNDFIPMPDGTGYVPPQTLPLDIRNSKPTNSIFGLSNKKYRDIKAGRSHFLLLTEDGTIETWGWNWYYTVTGSGPHPTGFSREGSGFTVNFDQNTGVQWSTTTDEDTQKLRPWPIITSSGDNTAPEVKRLKTEKNSVKAISCGYYTSQVIKNNGNIFAWDRNEWGESSEIPAGDFKQVHGGYHHAIGLKTDGTVVCWGENNDGECTVPPILTNPATAKCIWVRAQRRISFALQDNGLLWGWGNTTERKFGFRGFTSGQPFNTTDNLILVQNPHPNDIPEPSTTNQLKDWANIVANRITNVGSENKSRDIVLSYKLLENNDTWSSIFSSGRTLANSLTNSGQPQLREWTPQRRPGQPLNRYHPHAYERIFTLQEFIDRGHPVNPSYAPDTIAVELIESGCTAAGTVRHLSEEDPHQGEYLRTHLPNLALALINPETQGNPGIRLSNLNKLKDMIDKISKYTDVPGGKVKFQRTGWTIGFRGESSGSCAENINIEDGSYLGDLWITEPLLLTLDIINHIEEIGQPSIGPELKNRIHAALRYELFELVKNWKELLGWYTRGSLVGGPLVGQPNTNQWIEPACAMVQIPLLLEDQDLLPAYNLGVTLLLSTLIALQDDGSFSEGWSYSEQSVNKILKTLQLMKHAGDNRIDLFKPWIDRFWNWLLDYQLPGNYILNSNDSRASKLVDFQINSATPTGMWSVISYDGLTAAKNYKFIYPETNLEWEDLFYTSKINDVQAEKTIPNFNFYNKANLVVWRSNRHRPVDIRDVTSSAVPEFCIWAKGGFLSEGHKHRDEGQFAIYCGNRIVIMESGVDYDISSNRINNMSNASGHNIFQMFEKTPRATQTNCPMSVSVLNDNGGSIGITLTDAYNTTSPGVNFVTRGISWAKIGTQEFRTIVKDQVSLNVSLNPFVVTTNLFKFHTGLTLGNLSITGADKNWTITWPGTTMGITSNILINITGSTAENATYRPNGSFGPQSITEHKVIDVNLGEFLPQNAVFSLTTNIHTSKLSTDRP